MDVILCAGIVSGYDCRRQTGRVQLMAFFDNDGQTRGAWALVQGWLVSSAGKCSRSLVLVWLACVSGCSNYHTSGPEAWWHESIGGKIAEQRPPPPGSDDPYPNLATVPPKPAHPDTAGWNQMTAGLITDRIKADQAAALAPIPPASSGQGPRAQQPPGPEPGASAALVAASPPPAPGVQTPKSPTARAPLMAPAQIPSVPPVSSQATAQRVANGQLPPLPTEEPQRAGVAPPPPPPLVPVTATPPAPASPTGTLVDFAQGSAVLNDPALAEVKALATTRGDRGIAITGYGGATSSDPVAQSGALNLGLSRARVLATALVAQGVPYAMLRLNAESAGRGASLRLLQ
jgi:outer membrane protein OmpA-like peptidoglycan-associated protein